MRKDTLAVSVDFSRSDRCGKHIAEELAKLPIPANIFEEFSDRLIRRGRDVAVFQISGLDAVASSKTRAEALVASRLPASIEVHGVKFAQVYEFSTLCE